MPLSAGFNFLTGIPGDLELEDRQSVIAAAFTLATGIGKNRSCSPFSLPGLVPASVQPATGAGSVASSPEEGLGVPSEPVPFGFDWFGSRRHRSHW